MNFSKSGKYFVFLTCLAVLLMGANIAESAEDAASFYRGKTVRLVVPLSPGGGTDLHARLLAPVLEKYLKCTVVVINKPGGGGLVAMNDVYEAPRKDGLTLAISPEGLPLAQAVGASGVRFDARKFGWIASLYKDFRMLLVGVDSPYKTVDDLRKLKQPKAAMTAVTSAAGPSLILALEALNLDNAKLVLGYPGSTEVLLAVRRMEADFTVMTKAHALRKDPLVRPILAIEDERAPEFPNISAFTELGIKPETKKIMDIIMMGQASGRAVITSPGVSKEKIAFLRKMLAAGLNDPGYVQRVEKAGFFSKPLSGEKTAESVEKALNVPREDLEKLRHIMFEKYL
jgi:tripartite-type tricarboxylate transporter receptor subunit TctC